MIDGWLAEVRKPEDVNGLLKQFRKAVLERATRAEMTEQLGYAKHASAGQGSGNSRNGVTRKRRKGDFGEIDLETPRGTGRESRDGGRRT